MIKGKPVNPLSNEKGAEDAKEKVALKSLQSGDRTITFATTGDQTDSPVLFFYPAGGNRRFLASLHDVALSASLFLVCVNRPGTGGTSAAARFSAADHVKAVCDDIIVVLGFLGIERVGILSMCAGTVFAMAFASRHSNYTSSDFVFIAPYVPPADCPDAHALARFGALHCPLWLIAPLVGGTFASIQCSVKYMPATMMESRMKKIMSEAERKAFEALLEKQDWKGDMEWMFQEKGNTAVDIKVVLSKGKDIGIDYSKIGDDAYRISIVHGDNDKIAPYEGSVWLQKELKAARLTRLKDASHEGALFLLHKTVVDEIMSLSDDG